jgi:DNA-binding response OmpR family regulator
MSVVMVTSDLMFASRAAAVAKGLAIALRVVAARQAAADWCAKAEGDVKLVIVDLETVGADLQAVVAAVKHSVETPPVILAYGPHVQENRLKAAKAAGCDVVLSRGQFNGQMEALFQAHGD